MTYASGGLVQATDYNSLASTLNSELGVGSGSPTNLANNGNGGYWNSSEWHTNAWQLQFRQYDTAAGYTTDYLSVYIIANGATVSMLTYMVNGHVQVFQDAVDGTTIASTVISSPATTYLVNTWGTPTFSGTLTPI